MSVGSQRHYTRGFFILSTLFHSHLPITFEDLAYFFLKIEVSVVLHRKCTGQ